MKCLLNKFICFCLFLSLLSCSVYSANDPKIRNLNINDITENTATISWQTSFNTIAQVNFGTSVNSIFHVATDANKTTNHKVILKNLDKGTLYYFRIVTKQNDKISLSKIFHFKTKGIPIPGFTELKIYKIKPKSVKIRYMLNTPSKTKVTYHSKDGKSKDSIQANQFTEKGTIVLKNLIPETLYYYTIELENHEGEKYRTKVLNFSTPAINYALNKKVIGTFHAIPDDTLFIKTNDMISRIVDGKTDYFTGMSISGNINEEDQYIIIDLEKDFNLREIKVIWRALAYSRDYSLLISTDKRNWKKLAENLDASFSKTIRGSKGDPIKVHNIEFPIQKARYIKLFIKKGSKYYVKHKNWNSVHLMEIIVN